MRKFPILKTNRLQLIEISNEHSNDIYELFSDKEVTKFYNFLPFQNIAEAENTIHVFQNRFNDNSGIRWGISLLGHENIIGTVGFNKITKNHRASIGYDLKSAYFNQGYITEALKEVIKFGFKELKINRIEAEVMQGNIGSEKVLGKLNFTKEGILREWMYWNDSYFDMTMFSLLKSDHER